MSGKTEELGEKPVPVPLCLPQIPHGLTRERTRASAVKGRRLTAEPWHGPSMNLQASPSIGNWQEPFPVHKVFEDLKIKLWFSVFNGGNVWQLVLFMDRFIELDAAFFMKSRFPGASENIVQFHFWTGAGVDTETFILERRRFVCLFVGTSLKYIYCIRNHCREEPCQRSVSLEQDSWAGSIGWIKMPLFYCNRLFYDAISNFVMQCCYVAWR
jgi:hypothetical protein